MSTVRNQRRSREIAIKILSPRKPCPLQEDLKGPMGTLIMLKVETLTSGTVSAAFDSFRPVTHP